MFEVAAQDAAIDVVEQINYPSLRTIYPPVAQIGFAAAFLTELWSLSAWRGLASKLVTVVLCLGLLSRFSRPAFWVVLYWWNPLLVKELINSEHMAAVPTSLLMTALYLFVHWMRKLA